jgi:hypothetical protein
MVLYTSGQLLGGIFKCLTFKVVGAMVFPAFAIFKIKIFKKIYSLGCQGWFEELQLTIVESIVDKWRIRHALDRPPESLAAPGV